MLISVEILPAPIVTATSHNQIYVEANTVDGDANCYWESANNAFPQRLTVDLCATAVGKIVLKLPPATAWSSRMQTLSVLGSPDGGTFGTKGGSKA
ncbi:MAG: coagulation factor 5/8 type domain protein [Actinomycetia bacterium]|nr:coagulation factor 5/8 type domain protein [Actinomycetes bacterium]